MRVIELDCASPCFMKIQNGKFELTKLEPSKTVTFSNDRDI